jgi:hypothetical protein
MTVTASNEEEEPKLEMTWTIIKPTTSSIIAADVRTTPRRLELKPLVLKRVKVVPKLVEQSAAPAANAWNDEAPIIGERINDRPMGATMPVSATRVDRPMFALRAENDVDKPPGAVRLS